MRMLRARAQSSPADFSFQTALHPLHTNRHTPRKRGIQYAAAFRLNHWRLGLLDRPRSRTMTSEDAARPLRNQVLPTQFSNSTTNSNSKRNFAPRGAMRPRVCQKLCRPLNRGRAGMPGAQCTRSLVCESGRKNAHEYSQRVHRISPAFPHAMALRLIGDLPGDRAYLSPSPRIDGLVRARLGRQHLRET